MSGNSFGDIFEVTTFGESHGEAVGAIVDGVTPGIEIDDKYIQRQMDRRKPGQSSITTTRKEYDKVKILSGIFQGKTTGTPVFMILYNTDIKSQDYDEIKDLFRPGHADFTYLKKYGIRDYRGSGRASGRETAARVAAGALARKMLERRNVDVLAYTTEVGGIKSKNFIESVIETNPVRTCDPDAAKAMIEKIKELERIGDSCGGVVECRVRGVIPGLGEPVFDKLDADIAKAMLSIGSVKGIEFGAGFASATMQGSNHNDEIDKNGFLTNNAGGIVGGLSTGQDIIFRIAVKPTSSISLAQQTTDINNNVKKIITKGRHDPCICPRIVPVVEAMTCIVLEDHFKRHIAIQSKSF